MWQYGGGRRVSVKGWWLAQQLAAARMAAAHWTPVFDVAPGDAMYVAPEDRVKIW